MPLRSTHILLVEDDPREARLVIDRLHADGAPCTAVTISDRHALEHAVRSQRFDAAIIDYKLPGFDGFSALSLVKSIRPTLPVIMISGKAGEELVAESFHHGAEDYILKDSLGRLAPAIHRAMITAAQRAQRDELAARLARFGSFVPGMLYQYSLWPDGRSSIPYASEGIRHIFGVSHEEVRDNPARLFAAIHPEDLPTIEQSILASASNLSQWRQRYRVRRADGQERWVEGNASPERLDDHGTLWHGIIIDITDQRLAEIAHAELNKVVERQNESLKVMADRAHRVVDDVSHEFRTPLAVIKEFASIISDGVAGPVSPRQAEYLKVMDGAIIDLNHMVEDLLDSSKLRAGRLRLQRAPHRIEDILATARIPLARKASARSMTIEERIAPDLPSVFADEEKVRRVISNLVSNAIKFSPEGGAIVLSAARAHAHPALGDEVVLSVADQGPGLSPDDLDRLFGRFQQASTARSVAAKGFGLGLSIAQELSWLNLGALSVQSERGRGSVFSFSLPIDQPASIIRHFFSALAASDRPPNRLALLRVDALTAEIACPLEPGEFLASVTYPTDLILPTGTPRSWWVLGRSNDPHLWVDRLRLARATLAAEDDASLVPIAISLLHCWEYPDEATTAQDAILDLIASEPVHA